jgi:hypothetical protein
MGGLVTKIALVLFASLGLAAALPAAEPKSAPGPETAGACLDMMEGSGVTDAGRRAMREFMQSGRAPRAMANMMDMARRMGGGDLMLGMTRMMEMMGGMGGGMSGDQGVTAPGAPASPRGEVAP